MGLGSPPKANVLLVAPASFGEEKTGGSPRGAAMPVVLQVYENKKPLIVYVRNVSFLIRFTYYHISSKQQGCRSWINLSICFWRDLSASVGSDFKYMGNDHALEVATTSLTNVCVFIDTNNWNGPAGHILHEVNWEFDVSDLCIF